VSFHHADHLHLAIECVREAVTLDAAIDRMDATLRDKAAAAGLPDKYHRTVTVFWMRMVARLVDKDLPLAYYSPARLASDAARREWIEPDLQPMPDDATRTRTLDSPRDAPNRFVPRQPA
jgi:hypothetical protein